MYVKTKELVPLWGGRPVSPPGSATELSVIYKAHNLYSTAIISDFVNESSWLFIDDFAVNPPLFLELVPDLPEEAFGLRFGGVNLALCFFEEDPFFGVEPELVFNVSILPLPLLLTDVRLALLDLRGGVSSSMICDVSSVVSLWSTNDDSAVKVVGSPIVPAAVAAASASNAFFCSSKSLKMKATIK